MGEGPGEMPISEAPINVQVEMNHLTYQEHVLGGLETCKIYERIPYKPIGVIEGRLKVEEAAVLRREKGRMAAIGSYFKMPGIVQVSLEALAITGETKRDPQLLDVDMKPMNTVYSEDFPYRRKI